MSRIIRMQDSDGRGPWRPNFSHKWISGDNSFLGKPIHEDFTNIDKIFKKAYKAGKYLGCAMREANKSIWFTDKEIETLKRHGFYFVDCTNCEVLAESNTQVIIASHTPLKFLKVI